MVYLPYMDVSLGILCLDFKYRTASCIVESIENGESLERKRIPYSNGAEMMEPGRAYISRERKAARTSGKYKATGMSNPMTKTWFKTESRNIQVITSLVSKGGYDAMHVTISSL